MRLEEKLARALRMCEGLPLVGSSINEVIGNSGGVEMSLFFGRGGASVRVTWRTAVLAAVEGCGLVSVEEALAALEGD